MSEPTGSKRTRPHLALAAAMILLAAGGLPTTGCSSEAEQARTIRKKGRNTFYVCKSCGASGKTRIGYDDKFPIRCPQCDQVAAVGGLKCTRCSRFIEAQNKPVYTCPHCQFVYDNRLSGPAPGPAAPNAAGP